MPWVNVAGVNRRNRSVIFRVTEQEYDLLKSACAAAGGRNLSDYTRSELLSGSNNGSVDSVIWRRFLEIDQKLAEVYRLASEIFERIQAANNIPAILVREWTETDK